MIPKKSITTVFLRVALDHGFHRNTESRSLLKAMRAVKEAIFTEPTTVVGLLKHAYDDYLVDSVAYSSSTILKQITKGAPNAV